MSKITLKENFNLIVNLCFGLLLLIKQKLKVIFGSESAIISLEFVTCFHMLTLSI